MNWLKKLRGNKTQTELARDLKISQQFLCDIENGKRNPSRDTIDKIENLFNIPLNRNARIFLEIEGFGQRLGEFETFIRNPRINESEINEQTIEIKINLESQTITCLNNGIIGRVIRLNKEE